MPFETLYNNLFPAQRQEADQLFSRALQCSKNNDMVGAANYYRQSADMGHPGAQNNLGNQYKIKIHRKLFVYLLFLQSKAMCLECEILHHVIWMGLALMQILI